MADTKDEATAAIARDAGATSATGDDTADAERRLARYAAMGIPLATVGGAIVTGFIVGLGPAILVLAAGTLLGVIALLWASLRTLSGDAPLPTDLEAIAVRSRKVDNLGEQKRRVLRALKDLELEHSVGKIDDKDYASLGDRFRQDAKALMREMDGQIDPFRDEAERLAKRHLEKRGLGESDDDSAPVMAAKDSPVDDDEEAPVAIVPPAKPGKPGKPGKTKRASTPKEPTASAASAAGSSPKRVACPKCDVSNEPDAAFCKKCGTALTAEESHA